MLRFFLTTFFLIILTGIACFTDEPKPMEYHFPDEFGLDKEVFLGQKISTLLHQNIIKAEEDYGFRYVLTTPNKNYYWFQIHNNENKDNYVRGIEVWIDYNSSENHPTIRNLLDALIRQNGENYKIYDSYSDSSASFFGYHLLYILWDLSDQVKLVVNYAPIEYYNKKRFPICFVVKAIDISNKDTDDFYWNKCTESTFWTKERLLE